MNTQTDFTKTPIADAVSAEVKVHWPRGSSQSDRILGCPGSVEEQAKWPDKPAGPAAIDGTHTHTVLEVCVRAEVWSANHLIGTTLSDEEGDFLVEEDRAKRVNVVLDYIRERYALARNPTVVPEMFVDAGKAFAIPLWGGTGDIFIVDDNVEEGTLESLDLKDGRKNVYPDTQQLVTVTRGFLNEHPGFCPKRIRHTIAQPRDTSNPIRYKDMTYQEFLEFEKPLIQAMAASVTAGATRTPGDHCQWCRGAQPGRCEAWNRKTQVAAKVAFANVPSLQEPLAPVVDATQVRGEMSDGQMALAMDAIPFMEKWIEGLREEALVRFQAGRPVAGQKVIRTSTRQKYALADDEMAKKLKGMRLKKAVYTKEALISPTQLLKTEEVGELGERQRKSLDKLIVKPEGALKVVPEGARGKAVQFTPDGEEKSLEQQDAKTAFADVLPPDTAKTDPPAQQNQEPADAPKEEPPTPLVSFL